MERFVAKYFQLFFVGTEIALLAGKKAKQNKKNLKRGNAVKKSRGRISD